MLSHEEDKRRNAMTERENVVTMKGSPLVLLGNEIKTGDKAPDFEVVDKDLKTVTLSDFSGKVCVITTVPSLDTSVCDVMTRKFNTEATAMGDDVVVLAVSMDLPFGQNRWCIAADVKNVYVLSDHRNADFGKAFGVLIKDIRLLTRAVFVLDKQAVVRYIEIVPELTCEPDYERALEAVKKCL